MQIEHNRLFDKGWRNGAILHRCKASLYLVEPGFSLSRAFGQTEQVHGLLQRIEGDHSVSEHEHSVGFRARRCRIVGQTPLRLIPEVADKARIEIEGQLRRLPGEPRKLLVEILENIRPHLSALRTILFRNRSLIGVIEDGTA
ncbi:hypothetical protein D3C84_851890 [compost metagenome]